MTLQLQQYFETLIQCVATFYFSVSLMLAFIKSPGGDIYRPYRQSKRMLTVAFASMSANLFAWCVMTTGNWVQFNYAIACIDIILFYLEELLLCYSFCHILSNSFLSRRRITKDAAQMGAASMLVLAPLLPSLAAHWRMCLLTAVIIMVENIAELALLFRKQYKLNGELLDNYFSDDTHRFVRWTSRSIVLLIISWVFALVTMFTNVYVNWVFQIYMVSLNLYIAVNFINFAPAYGNIARAYLPEDTSDTEPAANCENSSNTDTESNTLAEKITTWVEAKKYVGAQFTIDELANALGTNKNYLSFFINERYGMNFSAWVSRLRVEEAKRLMAANPCRKLEDIAYQVGFSSPSYFSKVFSLHEGVAPTVWRKEKSTRK